MPKASMKKQTFWNEVRVKSNCRYTDLADLLGRSPSYCSMIFSGELLPIDSIIEKLCDFFDVDFEKGKAEFETAHREWISYGRGGGKQILATGSNAGYKHKSKVTTTTDAALPTTSTKNAIVGMIYGKISYTAFIEFTTALEEGTDVEVLLKSIYAKVTYEDFITIQGLLK